MTARESPHRTRGYAPSPIPKVPVWKPSRRADPRGMSVDQEYGRNTSPTSRRRDADSPERYRFGSKTWSSVYPKGLTKDRAFAILPHGTKKPFPQSFPPGPSVLSVKPRPVRQV